MEENYSYFRTFNFTFFPCLLNKDTCIFIFYWAPQIMFFILGSAANPLRPLKIFLGESQVIKISSLFGEGYNPFFLLEYALPLQIG